MEIIQTINTLVRDGTLKRLGADASNGYVFDELLTVNNHTRFTIQSNDRGIVAVYYKNSQFYDIPDESLERVVHALIRGDIVVCEDSEGIIYYAAAVDDNTIIEPEIYESTH